MNFSAGFVATLLLGNWKQITHPPYLPFCQSSILFFRLHSLLCVLHNKIEYKQTTTQKWVGYLFPVTLVIYLFPFFAFSYEGLTVVVSNQSGEPIENAVISAFVHNVENHFSASLNKTIVIDQIDKQFVSHVTPVQIGTVIDFPNHDQIRHHVYSFSSAKNFEIPLYKGSPANPITFEKAGMVSLGCNIHDWMLAYVYVVDTPYFTTTDKNGQASLGLPSGEYEIRYWHPNIDHKGSDIKQIVNLEKGFEKNISIQLGIKPSWSFRRGPLSLNKRGRYR